ncbi:hypothetical protein [Arthrobacter sp. A5]|uniref:hypothetical protein n=1 Tax=Arthrobacter sp. A5 TaxID=576926 RepID=UPI003DA8C61C
MSTNDRRRIIAAINAANNGGQICCPTCGIPLNYDRGGLPNTASANAAGTVTCQRCARDTAREPDASKPRITKPNTATNFTG